MLACVFSSLSEGFEIMATCDKKSLAFAVAALLASSSVVGASFAHAADAGKTADKIKCEGGNACKGKGACHGASNKCQGENACKGQGWIETKDQAECDAAKAALRDSAPAEKSKAPAPK